jgi:hypothetical protein
MKTHPTRRRNMSATLHARLKLNAIYDSLLELRPEVDILLPSFDFDPIWQELNRLADGLDARVGREAFVAALEGEES